MQKKKSKKKTIIVVVVILFILGAAFGSQSGKDNAEPTTTTTSNDSGKVDSTTDTEKIFKLGQTAEKDGVKITVKNKKISKGNDWGKPSKGNKFLILKVLVENNSDDDVIISSMADFEAYCDDYKLDYSSDALIALSVDKKSILDGTIASGKKLEGYLGYEVPKDWKSVEIHYTDDLWSSEKIKFVVEK